MVNSSYVRPIPSSFESLSEVCTRIVSSARDKTADTILSSQGLGNNPSCVHRLAWANTMRGSLSWVDPPSHAALVWERDLHYMAGWSLEHQRWGTVALCLIGTTFCSNLLFCCTRHWTRVWSGEIVRRHRSSRGRISILWRCRFSWFRVFVGWVKCLRRQWMVIHSDHLDR